MKTIKFFILPALLSFTLIFTSATIADGGKQAERINKSTEVLQDFGKMKEGIPHQMIAKYEGVVIIPSLINAGIGVGGKRGKGVAMVKLANGRWSDPVFITMTGGSLGPQIGVQSIDLVLVFRHKSMLTKVKNGNFTIGGDASATAGPVGRSASANTDYKLEAEVYSYSRSKGLFAGISINGASLSIDKDSNHDYYGDSISSKDIFATSKSSKEAVKTLRGTLASL
jgi:lipid-binding SYLF domain-containing protein